MLTSFHHLHVFSCNVWALSPSLYALLHTYGDPCVIVHIHQHRPFWFFFSSLWSHVQYISGMISAPLWSRYLLTYVREHQTEVSKAVFAFNSILCTFLLSNEQCVLHRDIIRGSILPLCVTHFHYSIASYPPFLPSFLPSPPFNLSSTHPLTIAVCLSSRNAQNILPLRKSKDALEQYLLRNSSEYQFNQYTIAATGPGILSCLRHTLLRHDQQS